MSSPSRKCSSISTRGVPHDRGGRRRPGGAVDLLADPDEDHREPEREVARRNRVRVRAEAGRTRSPCRAPEHLLRELAPALVRAQPGAPRRTPARRRGPRRRSCAGRRPLWARTARPTASSRTPSCRLGAARGRGRTRAVRALCARNHAASTSRRPSVGREGDPGGEPRPAALRPGVLVVRHQPGAGVVPAGQHSSVGVVGAVRDPPGQDVVDEVAAVGVGSLRHRRPDDRWPRGVESASPGTVGSSISSDEGVDERVGLVVPPRADQADQDERDDRADHRAAHRHARWPGRARAARSSRRRRSG